MTTFRGNSTTLLASMIARAQAVHPSLARDLRHIGARALSISKRAMTRDIYAKPVDVRPRSGKPKWKRTGRLRRGEVLNISTIELTATILNEVEYAAARHEMGKPTAKLKTNRRAHWRDEMIRLIRPQVLEIVHRGQVHRLRGGGT